MTDDDPKDYSFILSPNNKTRYIAGTFDCERKEPHFEIDFFEPDCVLGRESAPPKPNPDGIHKLLDYWETHPGDTVMVGDYHFDLEAGRRAGTTTVWLDIEGHSQWLDQADLRVQSLQELMALAIV